MIRAALRRLRYALPGLVGKALPTPGDRALARWIGRLRASGASATFGYFQADDAAPDDIVAAYRHAAALMRGLAGDAYLSVKAPPLAFDRARIEAIAAPGLPIVLDAHAPKDADATLEALACLLPAFPGTGVVLPARWRRSEADAAAWRDSSARIRLVKGEWADPDWPDADATANYLRLAEVLAGRAAPVAVATHDPALARRAIETLIAAGTPCELEQLRGLPRRRTVAIARRLGVPVRVYLPFGPGWWPYALNQALVRPYLPAWMLRDWLGRPDRVRPRWHLRND